LIQSIEYPNTKVVALDRDPLAISIAQELQKGYEGRLFPVHARFSDMLNHFEDLIPKSLTETKLVFSFLFLIFL